MHDPIGIPLADGDWTCRWIGNLHYNNKQEQDQKQDQDGIRVKSRIFYEANAGGSLTVSSSIHNLLMTIVGSRLPVKNNIVQQFYPNVQQQPARKDYTIEVDGRALKAFSKRIYRHLGFDGDTYKDINDNKRFMKDVVQTLRVQDNFAYSHAHCIPNANTTVSAIC